MRARRSHVFVNVPFDQEYEPLLVALVAALTAYDLVPRTVLEIPPEVDRLDRLRKLIQGCGMSVHDLSRVALDGDRRFPDSTWPSSWASRLGLTA
jgi:hypothetical protein